MNIMYNKTKKFVAHLRHASTHGE